MFDARSDGTLRRWRARRSGVDLRRRLPQNWPVSPDDEDVLPDTADAEFFAASGTTSVYSGAPF